eukprot:CAMPEP_0181305298 /NCGR_PEP_ID=MMETSP1101-20121128/9650_1 /TAXON_ID=46948 /ORGANISM="Rhodomonas abbreviata, Strain Caron Lab Isolate" /LENGTH=273 /DNA_ID=CAMNT_0023411195 /DNA_START=8 /DNA_END=826 /DNA_ORIENTATION=+
MSKNNPCPSHHAFPSQVAHPRPPRMFKAISVDATLANAPQIQEHGADVADDLENGTNCLTLARRPRRRGGDVDMEQFYRVYNVEVSDKPFADSVSRAQWTPRVLCEKGQKLYLKATWCFRQNHNCITQLILRLRTQANEHIQHFPVQSSVFGINSPEEDFHITFHAPEVSGHYVIDFCWDWQYSMRDAEARVENRGSAGKLVLIDVGEAVPWEKERIVWLGQQHEGSMLSLLQKIQSARSSLGAAIGARGVHAACALQSTEDSQLIQFDKYCL